MSTFKLLTRSEYTALHADQQPRHHRRSRCRIAHTVTLRRLIFVLVCTPFLILFALLCQGIPPGYDDVRTYERRLPQHSVAALTRVDDRPARYLRFPGHLWGHGLNNVLQEALLMSYLAHAANLSFVFEDYTWSHMPFPWTVYGFSLRPTRIPINAIISGPTAGGPMHVPLAVSAEYYTRVCSDITPFTLSAADAPNDADGIDLIHYWTSQLAHIDAQCIEIDSSTHDVFDRFLFGSPRILSLLNPLVTSPILSAFTWSPLVYAALLRNTALFGHPSRSPSDPTTTLPTLVAIHLRRGDYHRHCPNLATWNAHYMGVNQHPALPDRFDPLPYANATDAKLAYYLEHCLPTTTEVVKRLHDVRVERPALKRVFVLSNEGRWGLAELKAALEKDGWAEVTSSVDVQLDAEQYHVSMAVDMAIAERAEVFIGNGFSSLSSNVVMLRLAKGMDPSTNRFL